LNLVLQSSEFIRAYQRIWSYIPGTK
jgi:hypothetical protein